MERNGIKRDRDWGGERNRDRDRDKDRDREIENEKSGKANKREIKALVA